MLGFYLTSMEASVGEGTEINSSFIHYLFFIYLALIKIEQDGAYIVASKTIII